MTQTGVELSITVLAEIPIGPRDVLRVTRQVDHGREVVNLRRWFTSASGELRPGRDGIALGLDDVRAVLAALERARCHLTGAGAL